jgi:hypothetical protein
MDGFLIQVLDRLPLAEGVLLTLRHCWADSFLEDLFARQRGRCYEDKIDFATLVQIVCDALLRHQGTAHKPIRQAIDEGWLSAACSTTYQKLGRLPLALSMAFLRESTPRLGVLLPDALLPEEFVPLSSSVPQSLRAFKVIAFDGKTLKHATRRLKPLRAVRGKMLGGKLLVALNLCNGLVLAMNAEPDAFRNDVALVDGLLEQLPADPDHPSLFIADRQFCDLRLMGLIADQRQEHFIIRHNRSVAFVPDSACPAKQGTDANGRRFTDQIGRLGAQSNKNRRRVRCIILNRPGEDAISLITDLLDEQRYPGEQLLAAYRQRWGIEQVFQKVTEVFSLKHLIGAAPKATIFQAAFCFVLYNVIQLIKAHIARAARKELRHISTQKLFDDTREQLSGFMLLAGNAQGIVATLDHRLGQNASIQKLRKRLARLLAGIWTDWWIKSPTRPRPPTTAPKRYARSGRASVHRLLEEYRIEHKLHRQRA